MSIVAYLDPGTGGLIASAAAAGFAGAAVVAKSKWRSATGKLRKKDDTTSTGPDGTGADSA
ncbi:MAG: hypothetical protein ACR2JF_07095 [Iamia sp.]